MPVLKPLFENASRPLDRDVPFALKIVQLEVHKKGVAELVRA
jgi:hypothetical protein